MRDTRAIGVVSFDQPDLDYGRRVFDPESLADENDYASTQARFEDDIRDKRERSRAQEEVKESAMQARRTLRPGEARSTRTERPWLKWWRTPR